MAISETQSLEEISYRPKIKYILWLVIVPILFLAAFTSFYPVGEKVKVLIKSQLRGAGCNPDWDHLRIEWFTPKIVVSDLTIPASCLNRSGEPLKFNHVTLNYNLVNFSPLGLPFRLDTEFYGQPLSLYFVQGFGNQMVRLKDQSIVLSRLLPLLGDQFKIEGTIKMDLNLLLEKGQMKDLSFKATSDNLNLPSQSIQGFNLPNLRINKFFAEALSENPPRIQVEKLILGDLNSPIRANFKGSIDLQEGALPFSPIDMTGEVAFTENFKQTIPLIEMMFQQFTQKDGFYQIRLGGTLGAPRPSAP